MDGRKELIAAGRRMLHSGLTVETWGNLSLFDKEAGLIYLTPSGMAYDTLTESDICVCAPDGSMAPGQRKPTVEKELHLGLYRARPELRAIVHTHPLYSQVFACLHEPIPPIMDEAAQALGGTVYTADYALPGTAELAENCVRAMGPGGRACLLANHGAVCVGKDMDDAFKVCTVLEMTAHVYYMARCIGRPEPLSGELVAGMFDFAQNHYGQGK